MNKHNYTNAQHDLPNVSRRNAMKMAGASAVALGVGALSGGQAMASTTLELGNSWDKTFAKSDKVDHKKVTFKNRYGITLAAEPKELMIIPNANHTDLYDQMDVIPFDKMESFFKEYLA